MLCLILGLISIGCGWDLDRADAAAPEECPIHDDGDSVEDDRAHKWQVEAVSNLQPAADGGAECPAKIPCHAGEAGDCGARGRFNVFHDECLINGRTHVHQSKTDVIGYGADPEDGGEAKQDEEWN